MDSKKCARCLEEKSTTEFSPSKQNKDGLYTICKSCTNRNKRERYLKKCAEKKELLPQVCRDCGAQKPPSSFTRDPMSTTGLQPVCKECLRDVRSERFRDWAAKNPTYYRESKRYRKYGLTKEQYETLVRDSAGHCQICGVSFSEVAECLDHDHNTGVVRGFLCNGCNTGLGFFKDSVESLQRAVLYLQNHQ